MDYGSYDYDCISCVLYNRNCIILRRRSMITMHLAAGSPAGADEKVMMVPVRVLSADVTSVDLELANCRLRRVGRSSVPAAPHKCQPIPTQTQTHASPLSSVPLLLYLLPRLTTSRSSRLHHGF